MKGDHEQQEEARAQFWDFWAPQEVDDGLLDGGPNPVPKLDSDLLAQPIESISYVAGHLIWGMTGWVKTN